MVKDKLMATKIVITCDHCGHSIPKANKFLVGPVAQYDEDEDEDDEQPTKKSPKGLLTTKKIRVELCNACVPIWLDRVSKLTKTSDS